MMILTKESYDELVELLISHEFNVEVEVWSEKATLIAVDDGSFNIIPFPFSVTNIFAVPKSIPISFETKLKKFINPPSWANSNYPYFY